MTGDQYYGRGGPGDGAPSLPGAEILESLLAAKDSRLTFSEGHDKHTAEQKQWADRLDEINRGLKRHHYTAENMMEWWIGATSVVNRRYVTPQELFAIDYDALRRWVPV